MENPNDDKNAIILDDEPDTEFLSKKDNKKINEATTPDDKKNR